MLKKSSSTGAKSARAGRGSDRLFEVCVKDGKTLSPAIKSGSIPIIVPLIINKTKHNLFNL